MRYIILGAAPCSCTDKIKETVNDSDYIICADGGYDTAMRCGIAPDLFIGDMDSVTSTIKCLDAIKLPCQKDETDLIHAVKFAESKGASEIILFGATGGRIDHTFGNLCILKYLCEKNIKHKIVDENCEIIMACDEDILIEDKVGSLISVLPFGTDYCTVTYTGMEYPANSKKLYCNFPVGISNNVINFHASISVESGFALIFIYDKNKRTCV